MSAQQRILGPAALVGLLGGTLGMVAGVIQMIFGAAIPELTGHKLDPLPLGLLTLILSALSVVGAMFLRGRSLPTAGRGLAIAVAFVVTGGLCFSTVGALWYVPGPMLLTAGVLTLLAADLRATRALATARYPMLLVSLLGAFELLMAVSARPWTTMAVGLIGGAALSAALWPSSKRIGWVLLVVGTVPFAALTWSSLASPVLAIAALVIGLTSVRKRDAAQDKSDAAHVYG